VYNISDNFQNQLQSNTPNRTT